MMPVYTNWSQGMEDFVPQVRGVVDEIMEGLGRQGRRPHTSNMAANCSFMLKLMRRLHGAAKVLWLVEELRLQDPLVDRALTQYLQADMRELVRRVENPSPNWWSVALKVVVASFLVYVAMWAFS